jgi:hypothetical protein
MEVNASREAWSGGCEALRVTVSSVAMVFGCYVNLKLEVVNCWVGKSW